MTASALKTEEKSTMDSVLCELLERARELFDQGRFEIAVDVWREIVAMAPTVTEGHKRLTQCLHRLGRFEESLPSLRWMAKSGNVQFQRILVDTLVKGRHYAEAAVQTQRMLETSPDDERLQVQLARFAGAAGLSDVAGGAWQQLGTGKRPGLRKEYDARAMVHRHSLDDAAVARVVVMGNCQVQGIASCLRALLPLADVVTVVADDLRDRSLGPVIVDEYAGFNAIVSQPLESGHWGPLRSSQLAQSGRLLLLIPNFLFSGFHPDLLHMPVEHWKGAAHRFSEFHSALVMAAFRRGVRKDRVADLFNAYVFQRIGYFDEYDIATTFLLGGAAAAGFDLEDELREWRKGGVFVHTPNHPKISVLWTIAQKIAARLSLPTNPDAELPQDPYRANVWPVYPEIAKRLNVEGSYVFQPPKRLAIHLDEFIAESYATYAQTDFGAMRIPVVDRIMATLAAEGV